MNLPIFFIALVFWFNENCYFGWSENPKSDAELICDGMVLLMFILAIVCHRLEGEQK